VLAWRLGSFAHLAPRAAGPVFRVPVKLGQKVKQGDALLYVLSAEVGRLKADFLTAAISHDVKRRTVEILEKAGTAVPERQLREARQAVREAHVALVNTHQALANLGLDLPLKEAAKLSDDELAERVRGLGLPAGERGLPSTLLPVTAPFAGTVVRLEAAVGEMAEPSRPVVAVADTARVWCLLDVRQEDAPRLAVGQQVTFTGRSGSPAEGTLTWVSPEADPKTRTVRARAELANPGHLRPGVFGVGRVEVARREAVLVPIEAVQFDGKGRLVFLKLEKEEDFEPRPVLVGGRFGKRVEIFDPTPALAASLAASGGWNALGLLAPDRRRSRPDPGDQVVATGSMTLLSEMQKHRLGED
jgi:cobalt-zinc-cadmium efflux system membrane fusion protein